MLGGKVYILTKLQTKEDILLYKNEYAQLL